MVLFQGQRVLRLPLPPAIARGELPANAAVLTNSLGDLFLDYDTWLARMDFLTQRAFTCEVNGQSGLDFFTAANLEQDEREYVHSRFPSPLKGRFLRAVHFRVHAKLDDLVDALHDRCVNRFFETEKCFVELSGRKYFCRIACAVPGKRLSDLAESRAAAAGHRVDAVLPPNPWGNATAYGAVAHAIGTDLDIPIREAEQIDSPKDYRYVVQLLDHTGQFGGTTVEVREDQLSRDRQIFSKSMIKRFLKDCCFRNGFSSEPWQVKSRMVLIYGLPKIITPEIFARNQKLLFYRPAQRKAPPTTNGSTSRSAERRQPPRNHVPSKRAASAAAEPRDIKKPLKYPIEDLDLEPHSIFDARSLRKGYADFPALPLKPALSTDIGIDQELVEQALAIWSFLNNFGECLLLSSFTLDDFLSALKHDDATEPCSLVAEVHAVLLNILISEGIRCPGAKSVSTILPLPTMAAETSKIADGMSPDDRARYVKRGLVHARKWDRSARLKSSKGRKGWERYAIGALCQRGGLEVMPTLPRILKHLFGDDDGAVDELDEDDEDEAEASESAGQDDSTDAASNSSRDEGSPAEQYPSLPISDKLAILAFLGDLCLSCKRIRLYLETSEAFVTDLRKHRTEINKVRRDLDARKLALDKAEGVIIPKKKSKASLAPEDALNGDRGLSRSPSVAGEDRSASEQPDTGKVDGTPGLDDSDAKPIEKPDSGAQVSPAKSGKKGKGKGSPAKVQRPPDTREGLAAEMAENLEAEQDNERQLRSCREIARTQPLGLDRFFNAYLWLDGIGSHEMVTPNGSYTYGCGRIFVRGPAVEQWSTVAAQRGGTRALKDRQAKEEGQDATHLEPGQWAMLTTEAELDQLLSWLNTKGQRESKLKDALLKWRSYLLGGMNRRARDLRDPYVKPPPAVGDRRSARIAQEAPVEPVPVVAAAPRPRFLAWTNKLAAS